MNRIKLRLTLDVEFNPIGETLPVLKMNMGQVVADAVNNGTLTGESPATVENYSWNVEEIP